MSVKYAFPCRWLSEGNGMTIRQYYKAAAPDSEIENIVPSNVMGCAKYIGISTQDYSGGKHYKLVLAKARGEWADAMMKEDEDASR